ncbi:WecB/TagA/CpsF family glycosyltransferase [Pseudoxanthomonas sp. UTMC 1351]|uniref:WecB/TagA/CpsF family glycosyltransferase n=1 Tax=Pseudoxanthomonas sp. UTMC 1351 TaxID=2695853 RepID=UPI0034CF97DC
MTYGDVSSDTPESRVVSHVPDAGQALFLGGYSVYSLPRETLEARVMDACDQRSKLQVFFANTNFIVECRPLIPRLRRPSVCIVNDGIGMDLAALLVHQRRFAENLNGTDFIPYLCGRSWRPLRFFLLGGRAGVAEKAALQLIDGLGQQVVGTCDGYAEFAAAGDNLARQINESHADIVLVAFGNPKQEAWILDHCDAVEAPVMFGVGALLDFLSGSAKRAPEWVRTLHLEWLFRLSREPRRLLKRYSWDLIRFFGICLRAGRRA